jgi:predicted nucleotidyltransferase
VFYGAPASGAELARRTGLAQQTVARELARLEAAGVIEQDQIGTAKIPRPAADLPYLGPLRQLLAYAGGVIPALHERFGDHPEIDEVFIFGSWARRYQGEGGPPPNDIDVAVVSETLSQFDLARDRLELESELGVTIDLFVVPSDHERLAELRVGSVPVGVRRS